MVVGKTDKHIREVIIPGPAERKARLQNQGDLWHNIGSAILDCTPEAGVRGQWKMGPERVGGALKSDWKEGQGCTLRQK